MTKMITAGQAALDLKRAMPVDVPESAIREFNALVEMAIANQKDYVDMHSLQKTFTFLNKAQTESFRRMLKEKGFKHHYEEADHREHLSYDREWWTF